MARIEAQAGTVAADPNPSNGAGGTVVSPKKGPPKKIDHPLVVAGTKLSAVPDDFDPAKHTALKEDDFEGNKLDVFYTMKADSYRQKADLWATKAKDFAALGGIADRKTAAKALEGFASIKKSLEMLQAQGEDISNLDDGLLIACGYGELVEAKKAAAAG